MLKMVDGTGIIGVDMVCPLGGAVSPPQPPNYDNVEMEGVGSLMLPNSLKAPLERLELIGNSTQGENPAPDNPQEIKSAGRKSKNLFNIADLRVGQVQKDGTINEKQIYYRTVILDVPQDGKYRITFNSNDDYTMLYFTEAYANGAYSNPYIRVHAGSPNYYITLAKGKNILSFSTHTASGNIAFTTDHNIMIAAESETLDYEPYGYFFDVKITGKNLQNPINITNENFVKFDGTTFKSFSKHFSIDNDIITIGVTSNNAVWCSAKCYVRPNESYRISIIPVHGLTTINNWDIRGITFYDANDNIVGGYWNYNDYKFVAPKNARYAIIGIGFINRELLEVKCKIQIEYGTTATSYEPYTEQSVQIALDEPLRGIGEYKDVLTKDGVVRKIKRIVFDGSENWGIHKEKETTVSFWTNSFKFLFPTHNTMLVDKFAYVISGMNKEDVSWSVYGSNFYININKDIASNLESFKIWLSKNTVTVEYIAIEPTTEPLPESVQQQLQALHSENGTTHVFVDSGEVPCGIKLTYRKEK